MKGYFEKLFVFRPSSFVGGRADRNGKRVDMILLFRRTKKHIAQTLCCECSVGFVREPPAGGVIYLVEPTADCSA